MKKFAIQYTVNGAAVGQSFITPLEMEFAPETSAMDRLFQVMDRVIYHHNQHQVRPIERKDIYITCYIPLD